MTLEELEKRLDQIRQEAWDDERAHWMEDDLHQDVLRAIAAGHPDPRWLAALALSSLEIKFSRWYA